MNLESESLSSTVQLISNSTDQKMYHELIYSFQGCRHFIFSVAFISFGGLQLLLKTLEEARNQGISGKVLTSDYQNFTDPKALRRLYEMENLETKIYLQNYFGGFHTKAYIFEYEDSIKLYIGSSNITENALLKNVEWNVKIISKNDHPFVTRVMKDFSELWNKTDVVTNKFLDEYESFIRHLREAKRDEEKFLYRENTITPNKMQMRATASLHSLRSRGENKGLVIAATATGKTYMSAFDVRQVDPKRMLFLVHRGEILHKAIESFKKVLGSQIDVGLLENQTMDVDHRYVFATIQSMNNHYMDFYPQAFDYIIVDESHHATAESYQRVLNYFRPNFLLGMTATPERTDGLGLFSYFENNVAFELRLYDAIEQNLVCPFHYFGVTEAKGIDLSDLDDRSIDELTKRLSTYSRVDYIIEQLKLYGHDGDKLKCLGFCASIDHARFMADAFNQRGISAKCLTGSDSVDDREKAVLSLESSDKDSIQVLFTVDVFNEGIDIPSLNTVLLLRPTNSPIIFIQQIGRGLRKIQGKEFVTIIDFIGNYKKSFLIALALKGSKYYDKDSLKVAVKRSFGDLPGNSFVQMDEITKEQIIRQLEQENFNTLKYLKDEYINYKKMLGKPISLSLVDFEVIEGSPDPIRFIKHSGSYLDFMRQVENITSFDPEKYSVLFWQLYRQLSKDLPIKRSIEFNILSLLFSHPRISIDLLKTLLVDLIPNLDNESIHHATRNLEGAFLDSTQLEKTISLVSIDETIIQLSKQWRLLNENEQWLIQDIIKYGLLRFEREFEDTPYQLPFFKPYMTYSMRDTAQLSNEVHKFSSYRGQGVIKHGSDYYLFIDLNKSENIKASINYKDRILSTKRLQWESQNSTRQDSQVGQNIINNQKKGVNLHVFVRKFKKVDNWIQPFIYLGKANTLSYQGNKPITFEFELIQEIPLNIYEDLVL